MSSNRPIRAGRPSTPIDGEELGTNSVTLMEFNTWLAEQPELFDFGYVGSCNDHENVSTLLWWAGPASAAHERVVAEAHARGIQIRIHRAKYSRAVLRASAHVIFDAKDDLAAVNFTLASIKAGDLQHDGLRVQGYVPAAPDAPLAQTTVATVEVVLANVRGLAELMSLADIRVEHGPALTLF
jgi:hypothetical protein